MTKRDFELIAKVLNEYADDAGVVIERDAIAYKLAEALATTNERFDKARFLKACGVYN